MKSLIIFITILGLFSISYSQSTKPIKQPRIVYKNAKTRHKHLKIEILNKIIKPILRESREPIEEIVVDLCPEIFGYNKLKNGCNLESKGKLTISVTVNGFPTENTDGFSLFAWIKRNNDGSFGKDEYLRLLPKKSN